MIPMHYEPEDGGARAAERASGPLHECFDCPADAPLLRGIATSVEAPEEDCGYVFGGITAGRLRKLAERLEKPVTRAMFKLADTIERRRSSAKHIIEVRFVERPSGTADVVMDLADGVHFLTALDAERHADGVRT